MATLTMATAAGPLTVDLPDEAVGRVLAIMPGDTDEQRAQALGAELVAHCQRQATDAVVRAAQQVSDAFMHVVREQVAGGAV